MVSAAATAYAVNHVVLPPKLPQKDDRNVAHEVALFEIATHALESLKLHVDIEHVGSVIAAKATVDNLRATRDQNGNTSQLQLQTLLAQATNSGALGALPIEVKEQNAGILISRSSSHVNFEFFELSPKNDAAMSSGRLVRTFPGHASKIPIAGIDPDLIESISRTIATMTTQTAPGFQPQITKNKKAMDEQRDTSSPGLVTDFLMNIVTALGEPMDVHRITKNTREEVLWDNCLSPWRRSPLWLLLRVSLQLVLTRKSSDTRDADSLYKAFMVFLLARILDLVKIYWEDMGSETVHLVLAKLTRRLRKVELLKQDQCLRQDWAVQVHDSMSNAHEFIKKHWQNRIENSQAYIDVNSIASLKPKSDVDLDLSGLDAFLSSIKSRKREASLSAFTPASKHSALRSAELPKCEYLSNSGEGLHFRLCTFEEWVKHHLIDWAKTHLRDREACGGLRSIMVSYHNTATSVYAGTPIGMSIMYLTVAELWVACDTIACSIYPMLPEYDPEIDLTEFQCLVLPLKGHLQRLWGVECYVKSRRHAATEGRPSVYRKFGDISSFAVRYFELCKPMQTTLSKLEADAAIKRRQKCGELASLQREYRQCMDRYNSLECETEEFVYNTYHGYTEERHSGRCRKCAARTRADGLKIEIYEWPISSEASKAKATIFELLVPGSYGNWRDASAYFITTVLGYKDAKPQVPVYSDVKKAVALLKEDDVCLDSALQYAYYDTSSGCFTTDTLGCTSEVLKKCMYPMLKRSKALQPFMSRPPASPDGCHPNNVIAGLSDCPLHLSIDEYKALGTLSLGHNIIYSNVLAQLAIPSVDWTKIETQCMILQAVQQTGPPGQGSERSCHSILTESAFGHAMLEQLESNLGRIQMNWESFRAAATFSLLARRVLSLTYALDVRYRAFRYLESLRSACSGWLRRLKQRVAASTDDGQRTDLCSRATEIALLCTSTYDVEEADFGTVLRNESAISILLQSTTVVHEHHATAQSEFPELFSITLESWRSLMVRIFPKLRSAILADGSGLSDAVKTSWAAFEISSGNSWSTLNRDQPQWLCTISGSLPVHFNLLTGELLVNGLPLAHLPVEYTQHAMYAPLFRKSALEVMPTNEAGLRFSAKSLHLGYKLHFGINGGDMLLCAIGHGKRLDLLPSRLFRDLIPESLVTHAVHMYDSHAQEVLFRPLYSPWSTEDDDTRWRLVRHGTSWRLVNKDKSLAASAVDCNRYDLATWLGTISFNDTADVDAIQAFASFYRLQDFSAVQPPALGSFQLGEGHEYHEATIRAILQNRSKSFDTSEEARLPRQGAETKRQHHTRILLLFETRQNNAIQKFISDLQSQWPVRSPTVPSADEYSTYLNVTTAMTTVRSKFQHWFNNRLFMQYLHNLSTIMARQATSSVVVSPYLLTLPPIKNSRLNDDIRHYSMTDIFATTPPPASGLIAPCEPKVTIVGKHTPKKQVQVKDKLGDLCAKLMMYANSTSERRYVEDLQSSCSALDSHNDNTHEELLPNAQPLLEGYLSSCQAHFGNFQFALNGLLSRQVAYAMQLSPRICTKFWLSQLHKDRFDTLSPSWKETIIQYALAVTSLQRAQRLVRLSDKPIDLVEELGHVGHQNWDVNEFPETLLIEAESGILVRKEQEYIASQMRSPKDGDNIVLQLLMGGGKSTTILPILGAFHGNKEKLVRVVVAKPQSQQMLHMLVAKLGGLLNRKVYQMPFSRNIRLSAQDANTIREIYEECVRERGVLLIQPEHILSFKLMAIECVLTNQLATAQSMLATQKWFDEVSCDCIDESDENFSTKFELIYTMGNQSSVEYAPERWLIIQDILALLPNLAKQVKEDYPDAVDIQGDGDGRYPRIRFLRSDAADLILRLLATRVVESGVGSPSRSQSSVMQAAILRYISVKDLETHEIHTVEKSKFWTATTKPSLLLLRGLFAGGVLKFIFSMKRSRVNFGLDKLRTPSTRLAVPFRSKDSPSPRSEYAHPDVIIILTLLSWYYEGLSDDDLFDTLTHVVHSDQSVIHYDEFVHTACSGLPKAFRQLTGVSLRDRHQCIMEVFPYLRYSKKAVDYYLSYLVFPKELKQFPLKLSASGWDLATPKPNPTTGFSGTNDTMHLLPLNMHHLDLPSQQHTNARVLSYLLMDETSVANLPARTIGCTDRDGQHLLAFIERLSPDIRVFLDCGASILEMNNREVAETWLKLRDDDVLAVIYFENEELSVLDRTSKVESFQTSPYAKMLDSCIVYLDESHTRGTDIPGLPRHYRAALTLGSQLTKDRLTQAAMRLRKLGNGQSVCFVVPGEIQTKIWEQNGKPTGTTIEVHDVLAWAIGETWSDLRRTLPLWAVQGNRFESHRHLLVDGAATTKRQAKAFLEKEAASLETRYMPRKVDKDGSAHIARWDMSNQSVSKIVSRCRDFEAMGFGSAALSEEQERELAPEIEEERQIERPSRLKAHPHNLHQDLKRLVDTGKIDIGSKAWKPAFKGLDDTIAGRLTDLSKFPDDLLVTRDFIRTVEVPLGSTRASFKSDSYQRPVQFILSVPSRHRPGVISNLIIISPWEANQLLPQLRQSKTISLHIFAPRSNVSYASLDELTLYTVGRVFSPGSVPRSLTIQLNLFAGSLYLRSLSEYTKVCDHLGLLTGTAKDGQQVYADGFIDPPSGIWGLKKSPVPFLRALLLRIRRGGEGVEKTHMGKVLDGVRLEESDFAEE
ncbi:uncharacterized protein J4E84_005887 [Alternaria hordeiaustralica]|uniref:uncharacterized protein n=1 Tax=Alternaria hordeiaustralica TaxID=1187925 RepID=UPI0020C25B9D|nr:uncharacterized protein J4E84_005887 [Alternaria hordeiaustralica]KAI4686606.1 hypothetical protein J4E84_005887 [Alternaria hordeiaustralica]